MQLLIDHKVSQALSRHAAASEMECWPKPWGIFLGGLFSFCFMPFLKPADSGLAKSCTSDPDCIQASPLHPALNIGPGRPQKKNMVHPEREEINIK